MTTRLEQAYLYWYVQNKYSGKGEIADLGCWLGSASICLAKGLEANKAIKMKNKRIHAYDIFIWEPWMDKEVKNTPLERKYKSGDSFIDEYTKRVNRWENLIEIHSGDLKQIGWDKKYAIEFLFNDASKTWDLTNSIIQNFYPSLIPGVSIYIEQDFAHYYTSWIHLVRYRFRDYFKPILHIPFSGSVVFKYIKPVLPEMLNVSYSFSSFSEDEIDSAFEYSMKLVSPQMQGNVLEAKVMFFIHKGDMERALYEFKKAVGIGFDLAEIKSYFPNRP